mgnify:CR=1 FL=1|jgi:hypothetical protein
MTNTEIAVIILVIAIFTFVVYILTTTIDSMTEKMTDKEFENKVLKFFNSSTKPKFSDYTELIKGTSNLKYKTLDSFLFLRKRRPLKPRHLSEMRVPKKLVTWKRKSKK